MNDLKDKLESLLDKQKYYVSLDYKQSAKLHYEITKILEEHGKELSEYKYYYRAKTYNLAADILVNQDLREIAIDAYFRSLIFQDNFKAIDKGKLLFETISSIMDCYYGLSDGDLLPMMVEDFDQKIISTDDIYKNAWNILKQVLNDKFHNINDESIDIQSTLMDESINSYWFYKFIKK